MTPSQIDLQQWFEMAVRHHRAGRLTEAEAFYRQVLSAAPDHAEALHRLGVLAGQSGRAQAGIEMIRRAIAARPGQAAYHFNLGEIYRRSGMHELGAEAYVEAARLQPKSAIAHLCLGLELRELGRLQEALTSYQQAIRLDPTLADAYAHLTIAAMQLGRIEKAIEAQQALVRLRPGSADAWSNLGMALAQAGRTAEAIEADRHAIALDPSHADARNNLATALGTQGKYEQALIECREALRLQPELPEAHHNLGTLLVAMWRLDEACASFGKAIALRPGYAQAHDNLGIVLNYMGQHDQAMTSSRKALGLRPDDVAAHSNLVFALNYHPAYEARAMAEERRCWNGRHAQPLQRAIQPARNQPDPDRRLKVGYVSPDFCGHAVGRNLLPLFREHARDRFEVFCYANVLRPDEITRQFHAHCDGWRSIVGMSDDRVAELVRNDGIDILVDLALHTAGNRLLVFARKPAPVQVTFGGYPGSTGLDAIDYRLTDPYLDPPGCPDEQFYSEQSIRLPDSFWCYDPAVMTDGTELGPRAGPLPALSSGQVTFGCLNNFCKVNEQVLALWARVMNAAAGSRLMLLTPQGSARQRTLEAFGRKGIDPARVKFVIRAPLDQYFKHYDKIDIGLDTFPYNGHTTSLDALWMGVPVVTLAGSTVVGRAGVSQLTNLNLTELVGTSEDQYVCIAAELAGDLPRLSELRAGLRQRMRASPLTDAVRFARNIETAYRQIWRRWCGRWGE